MYVCSIESNKFHLQVPTFHSDAFLVDRVDLKEDHYKNDE